MKIEKVKNRLFYDIGVVIILIGFIYVFIRPGDKGELQDYLMFFFLVGSGFCAAARAYYFDRYLRINRKMTIVDFWLFFNDTKFEWLMFIYFYIRPVLGKKKDPLIEKTRKRINFFAFGAYFFLTGLILFLILT